MTSGNTSALTEPSGRRKITGTSLSCAAGEEGEERRVEEPQTLLQSQTGVQLKFQFTHKKEGRK